MRIMARERANRRAYLLTSTGVGSRTESAESPQLGQSGSGSSPPIPLLAPSFITSRFSRTGQNRASPSLRSYANRMCGRRSRKQVPTPYHPDSRRTACAFCPEGGATQGARPPLTTPRPGDNPCTGLSFSNSRLLLTPRIIASANLASSGKSPPTPPHWPGDTPLRLAHLLRVRASRTLPIRIYIVK
jgi:hypothetical protein